MKTRRKARNLAMRAMLWMGVVSSGALFGGSCNTEVRSIVLAGLNELTVALIDAFFVTLDPPTTASLETPDVSEVIGHG